MEKDPIKTPLPGEFFDTDHGVLWNVWTTPEILRQCQQFSFRSDDVIVATFPKSGTTLMQEMLWLLHNHLDVEKARQTPVYRRVPFLEVNMYLGDENGDTRNHIDLLQEMPSNELRLIKTHLPLSYLRHQVEVAGSKMIYVARNPKDTMVSYYHFYRGVVDYGPWKGSFTDFFHLWMSGHTVAGDWFKVVAEWWAYSQVNPNVLFILYEDLLTKPREEFQRVAEFCGRPLTSEQLDLLVAHTRFDAMKANPSTNYSTMPGVNYQFMRKGQIGDWKNYFTVAQNEYFDAVFEAKYQASLPLFRYQ